MYYFLLIFIALINLASSEDPPKCGRSYPPVTRARIVGGRNARDGEFPWQVSIRLANKHNCGGSIIGDYTVLTAAHCVARYNRTVLTIRYNTTHVQKGIEVNVTKLVVHPLFMKPLYSHDIALVYVAKQFPIGKPNVNSVCLPDQDDDPVNQTMVTAVGWGRLQEEGLFPDRLQAVDVPIVDREDCRAKYKRYNITDMTTMVCTGFPSGGKSPCGGDSGGPLISRNSEGTATVRGLVSFAAGCARAQYPNVYARVGLFVDNFIRPNLL